MILLIPNLQELASKVKTLHIVTQSPCSQYTARSVVKVIHQSKAILRVSIKNWNFRECGHWKGLCISVGSAINRLADIAVKKGVSIA